MANGPIFTDGANVGIGTTNPEYKLQIQGNVSIGDNTVGIVNPKLVFNSNSTRWFNQVLNSDYYISQDGGAGNVLTIKNATGNVGIGTTEPTAKLDVLTRNEGLLATFRPHSDVITYTADSFINVGYGYPVNIGTNYNTGRPLRVYRIKWNKNPYI